MVEIDMSVWTGRDDTPTEGPNALRWWQCVKPYTPNAEPGLVLIGFACDEGVRRNGGRIGAKDGPRAIRKALSNLAWVPNDEIYDIGDLSCEGENLETAQKELAATVGSVIQAGHHPLVIGGGHETAWGTFQGIASALPDRSIGIINLDAHFDIRPDKRSTSGTPFAQMAAQSATHRWEFRYLPLGISSTSNTLATFDRARELGIDFLFDEQMELQQTGFVLDRLLPFIQTSDVVFLSIDLDVLPPWIMPAVSAPSARGIALEMVELVIDTVANSGKLEAVDVVEFNPQFDTNQLAARTAARLIARFQEWVIR